MNITSFVVAIREIAATFIIAILLPCMVHRGVAIFMHEPERVAMIYKKTMQDRSDEEKETVKMWKKRKEGTLFSACLLLGLLALLIGYCISVPSLATGLLLGGGLTIFTGYISYWANLDDLSIFISMLIAFVGLVFVLYKKR